MLLLVLRFVADAFFSLTTAAAAGDSEAFFWIDFILLLDITGILSMLLGLLALDLAGDDE